MKTKYMVWAASLFIALVIVFVIAAFNQPVVSAQNLGAAPSSLLQTTPTPAAEDASEIGSTDGIFIMGVVIIVIVIVPVLFYRKKN
jgi:uncharacterized integral membrane protein